MIDMVYIHGMNLASLDLNLLVALDALVREAHVGRAASKIGLSQPAASHALARLREILGDPVLVRVGSRMQLTPRARALRTPLQDALEQVRGLFVAERFDPATSERRFAMMVPDHVVDLLAPALVKRIAREAPAVRVDVIAWRGMEAMTAELARSVDLVIACVEHEVAGFRKHRFLRDTEALAVARGHRLKGRLERREVFEQARHVAVVGRGRREDPVDEWLRGLGITRKIALTVPGYLQALHVAAQSDLVAFVPLRMIEAWKGALRLAAVEPPENPGMYEEFLFYPARLEADAGSAWLRRVVMGVGRELDRG